MSLSRQALRLLGALIAAQEPMRRVVLAREMGIAKGSITRLAHDLVNRGLAADVPRGGRAPHLEVTTAGRAAWAARDTAPSVVVPPVDAAPSAVRPRHWQILSVVSQLCEQGPPPSPAMVGHILGLTRQAITKTVPAMVSAGLLRFEGRTSAMRLSPTLAGLAATEAQGALVPPALADEELPASVPLSERGADVLRFYVAAAREGRVPVYEECAAAHGVTASTVLVVVEKLERDGLVSRGGVRSSLGHRLRVTALGFAADEGRVSVVSHYVARSARMTGRDRPTPRRVCRARRSVGDVRAAVARVQAQTPPALPAALPPRPVDVSLPPAVPPGLDVNAPRPIRHPAPPAPAPKPAGMSAARWLHLSTPKTVRMRGAA